MHAWAHPVSQETGCAHVRPCGKAHTQSGPHPLTHRPLRISPSDVQPSTLAFITCSLALTCWNQARTALARVRWYSIVGADPSGTLDAVNTGAAGAGAAAAAGSEGGAGAGAATASGRFSSGRWRLSAARTTTTRERPRLGPAARRKGALTQEEEAMAGMAAEEADLWMMTPEELVALVSVK
jgi:hypothetical protein